MPHERIMTPMFRKLHTTVTNEEFSAFLRKARDEGRLLADGRVDIESTLHLLVTKYSEGLVVVLNAHELEEAKRHEAKRKRDDAQVYGKEM